MTDKIKSQILEIRDSGVTNMLDVLRIQREANDRGFFELVIFLEENRAEYIRFIFHGDRLPENRS